MVAADASSPFDVTIDGCLFLDGLHTITARVVDEHNQVTTSSIPTVFAARAPALVRLSTLANESVRLGWTPCGGPLGDFVVVRADGRDPALADAVAAVGPAIEFADDVEAGVVHRYGVANGLEVSNVLSAAGECSTGFVDAGEGACRTETDGSIAWTAAVGPSTGDRASAVDATSIFLAAISPSRFSPSLGGDDDDLVVVRLDGDDGSVMWSQRITSPTNINGPTLAFDPASATIAVAFAGNAAPVVVDGQSVSLRNPTLFIFTSL